MKILILADQHLDEITSKDVLRPLGRRSKSQGGSRML